MALQTTCLGAFPKPDYLPIKDWFSVDHGMTDQGGKVTREPGPMKHGKTVLAFVEDPDGYKVELIEESSRDLTAGD